MSYFEAIKACKVASTLTDSLTIFRCVWFFSAKSGCEEKGLTAVLFTNFDTNSKMSYVSHEHHVSIYFSSIISKG